MADAAGGAEHCRRVRQALLASDCISRNGCGSQLCLVEVNPHVSGKRCKHAVEGAIQDHIWPSLARRARTRETKKGRKEHEPEASHRRRTLTLRRWRQVKAHGHVKGKTNSGGARADKGLDKVREMEEETGVILALEFSGAGSGARPCMRLLPLCNMLPLALISFVACLLAFLSHLLPSSRGQQASHEGKRCK